jgi:hypothetical protein
MINSSSECDVDSNAGLPKRQCLSCHRSALCFAGNLLVLGLFSDVQLSSAVKLIRFLFN